MSTTAKPSHRRALRIDAVQGGVAISVALFVAIGSLLVIRRIAGAFTADLPLTGLVPTAALTVAIIFAGRVFWRSRQCVAAPTSRLSEQCVGWGGSIALLLLAAGCSDFSRTADWVIWLPLVVADQFQRQWFVRDPWFRWPLYPAARRVAHGAVTDVEPVESAAPTEQLLQQLVRFRDAAGNESIRGTLQAEFVPGQRHATIHVGFCPQLAQLPQVEAEPADGPESQVKIVQALPHGARLEVRLAQPAPGPCCVGVEFAAFSPRSMIGG